LVPESAVWPEPSPTNESSRRVREQTLAKSRALEILDDPRYGPSNAARMGGDDPREK
jgi:hypothetical protein